MLGRGNSRNVRADGRYSRRAIRVGKISVLSQSGGSPVSSLFRCRDIIILVSGSTAADYYEQYIIFDSLN